MRLLIAAVATGLFVVPSIAAETPPTLPDAAKKLTGPEITELYDGASVNWHNYTMGGTGTVTYNLDKKTEKGTWSKGGKSGDFAGTIRVKGDKFCYKTGKSKEVCDSVYTDATNIYEVNAKGVVESMNQKK